MSFAVQGWVDGSADLEIANANTGRIRLREENYGKLSETPVIDSVNRHIYLNNYFEALCFKIPDFD